jgi:hypothetical protein
MMSWCYEVGKLQRGIGVLESIDLSDHLQGSGKPVTEMHGIPMTSCLLRLRRDPVASTVSGEPVDQAMLSSRSVHPSQPTQSFF